MRRLSPNEVRAVADLLSEEHEDVEELAKAIVRRINQMRSEEELWVRAVKSAGCYQFYGVYRSAEEGHRDASATGAGSQPMEYRMYRLLAPWGQQWEGI